ncbi:MULTISPECIES: Cys-tRNA(Pro) deacylase [unclassified Pseudoalteromonas]|uniref:Cys-tRNA(Pro) deacylase n=1 Tax=unclassified Pseudoalteromonas TaxID=194690 RepID=UPI000CF72126|nr:MULTISPECIES: Cys-tRNA(Pro) deacylase [unclassified Pseudoalteromonas]MBS3797736.1 Cys-tRNA(Pro) deacylase [Pseudoalteromonas sp. BDTF-M6]
MTPAVTFLTKHKVAFELISFEHDSGVENYGQEVIDKLALDAARVFKTLVLETAEQGFVVAITPVHQQVNTKSLAKLAGSKKAAMAAGADVERVTGYVLGGVSPFAQKKRLPVYVHQSALAQDTIYVSAGKRGVELALAPQDLITLLQARCGEF